MIKLMKNQSGITITSLIVMVIILLILASVGLNMAIGENGVIEEAEESIVLEGVGAAEHFVTTFLSQNYDEISEGDTFAEGLNSMVDWVTDVTVGTNTYYVIDKTKLPPDTSKAINGGEGGSNSTDRENFIDVYGVTEDLEVYYCSNGLDSVVGVEREDLN